MAHELKELCKFGGMAFMVSGMLFLARHLLDFMAGPPPNELGQGSGPVATSGQYRHEEAQSSAK